MRGSFMHMGAGPGIPAPVNSEMSAFGAHAVVASWKTTGGYLRHLNGEMTKHHTSCAAACLSNIQGQPSADLS